MADILKIRRTLVSGTIPAPASLSEGELAANIADKKLWIGDTAGDPVEFPMGAGNMYLNDILDVEVPVPEGGDRLAWDGDVEKWISKRSLSALGIMEFEYTMQLPSDSTPAIKQISRNNDDPALTTILYLNKQDQSRADISLLIAEMRPGDWLNLHRKNDTDKYEKYDVIGTPVKVGDVWQIPVDYYEHANTLSDGNRVRLLWRIQGHDTDNYREPMGSGLHHGGQLSQGTGPLEVNVAEGRGMVVDATTDPFKIQREDVTWDNQVLTITPLSIDTQEIHMIFVDAAGVVQAKAAQDIAHKLIYDYIRLGWVELSQNSIITVVDAPNVIGQTSSNLSDMFHSVRDSAKSKGMRLQACNNGLQLFCEKGVLFIPGVSWYVDKKAQNLLNIPQEGDENTPITFQIFNQNAKPVMSPQTELPKYYDNNGNHTPLTGGEAVIHYIFYSAAGYSLQMGQTPYLDFAAAFRNLDRDKDNFIFAPGADLSGRSILLGQVIISKLAKDFNNKALADIVSTINNESGNVVSPIDLTLVPQFLLRTIAAHDLAQGDELSMDINGNMQKYPATGGEGDSQFTMDTVIWHGAMFLNNSNSQGVICWVNNTNSNIINFVTAQGNPDSSISYSPAKAFTVGANINALRICRIDNTRAGFIWSDNNGTNLGVVQINGMSSTPSVGTTRNISGTSSNLGADCVWDYSQSQLIGVFVSGASVSNRYCEISGNNVESPPYSSVWMMNGNQVRCATEGSNIIVVSVYNGNSVWREAAWNKPFWGTGRYDDLTNERQIADCDKHCGLKVQSGTILAQFEKTGSLQTYMATYSSGDTMNAPVTYGTAISGKSGDLIKTDSGIGYTLILDSSNKIEVYEGTLQGSYELIYTTAFTVDPSNTELQALMFGSIFAAGIGYNAVDANKVFLINSAATRTDHFIGVAPTNVLQGQEFNVNIALPMITLPREYPPGTTYNYGPYKYQVITHNQAVMIVEATIIQTTQA